MMVGYKDAHLTANQHSFNKRMLEIRVFVERALKKVDKNFTHIDFGRKGKISVTRFALWYYDTAILWNIRVCLYVCPTASYFDCEPPSLETYIQQIED